MSSFNSILKKNREVSYSERHQVTTHKECDITKDPNDWANEVGNPKYFLDLLLSIINVSLQTVNIVEGVA